MLPVLVLRRLMVSAAAAKSCRCRGSFISSGLVPFELLRHCRKNCFCCFPNPWAPGFRTPWAPGPWRPRPLGAIPLCCSTTLPAADNSQSNVELRSPCVSGWRIRVERAGLATCNSRNSARAKVGTACP